MDLSFAEPPVRDHPERLTKWYYLQAQIVYKTLDKAAIEELRQIRDEFVVTYADGDI
jgi:hypothetical protein